ncbi:hypothetical protein PAXRUDRAFT_148351 [Paxillus rubicundulus Ve08.2h10]|uniref:RBR-type E3 ubiquitin transferase n=1 Tax=Paxillus rubicundulus Ve08.2h10 TaxID=930991 RepID=A0A0D0D5M0_9AGAM|nr:hypothetical protein PAXRUDRAFT_148351 [Paxillus rubicundulus Ve08.2h10]
MTSTGINAVESSSEGRVGDTESALLVAELVLDDIAALEVSRKGEKRDDAPLSDEELAIQLQAASIKSFIGLLSDHQFASSIDRALETDASQLTALCNLDEAEHDDHRAAIALEVGQALPPQTPFQRMMEAQRQPERLLREPSPTSQIEACDWNVEPVSEALEDLRIVPTPSTAAPHQFRIECVICGDRVVGTRSFQATCCHYYCRGCLVDLVQTSLRDERLHPLRCCHQELALETVFQFISASLRAQFVDKRIEFATPSPSRVYCPNPRCSRFLGGSGGTKQDLHCEECGAVVCSECKDNVHPGEDCQYNQATLGVKALAAASGWKTCPGCHAIVELNQGCYHITCRCSTQFCYLCSARWRTCGCRQWDEQNLLNDAERRVFNEFGAGEAELRPDIHAERVHDRMEELRHSHECVHHSWRFRHGCGECEECGDFLPVFLMRCTNCQTLACRRCSVNRL